MQTLNLFTIFLLFVGVQKNLGAPVNSDQETKILDAKNLVHDNGNYEYRFVLSDGSEVEQNGVLKEVDGNTIHVVSGFYTFVAPDGLLYRTNYIADENGFRLTPDITQKPQHISPKAIANILG